MTATVTPASVQVGTVLPELSIHADPPFVVSTALPPGTFRMCTTTGTGDRPRVKDIFVIILTDTGIVQRFRHRLGRAARVLKVDLAAARRPALRR